MATPVRHRDKWRIRWFDATGNRQSEVYDNRRDAELALRRHEVESEEVRRGIRPAPSGVRSFSDLVDRWLNYRTTQKRSPKDDQSILRKHLVPAFGELRLSQITSVRIDDFRAGLEQSPKTVHNILTLLVAMLNYAVELGWLLEAQKPRVRKPRVSLSSQDFGYLRNQDEIRRFLAAALELGEDVHALYATAIYTGMRAGELAGLQWSDVDLTVNRIITVKFSYAGPTKADYLRRVPILDPLLPLLKAWRLRSPGALVFPSRAGTMLTPSARIFQEIFRRVLRSAGLSDQPKVGRRAPLTFHGLRHTFASQWMMAGGDLFKLQRICGWKSPQMVQRYAHLSPDAFATEFGRLGTTLPSGVGEVLSLGKQRSAS